MHFSYNLGHDGYYKSIVRHVSGRFLQAIQGKEIIVTEIYRVITKILYL